VYGHDAEARERGLTPGARLAQAAVEITFGVLPPEYNAVEIKLILWPAIRLVHCELDGCSGRRVTIGVTRHEDNRQQL
jgi:hypothetical protein